MSRSERESLEIALQTVLQNDRSTDTSTGSNNSGSLLETNVCTITAAMCVLSRPDVVMFCRL